MRPASPGWCCAGRCTARRMNCSPPHSKCGMTGCAASSPAGAAPGMRQPGRLGRGRRGQLVAGLAGPAQRHFQVPSLGSMRHPRAGQMQPLPDAAFGYHHRVMTGMPGTRCSLHQAGQRNPVPGDARRKVGIVLEFLVYLRRPRGRAAFTQPLHRLEHLSVPRAAHVARLHPIQCLLLTLRIQQDRTKQCSLGPHAEAFHHALPTLAVRSQNGGQHPGRWALTAASRSEGSPLSDLNQNTQNVKRLSARDLEAGLIPRNSGRRIAK